MSAKVNITVNGEVTEIPEGISVTEFLEGLGVDPRQVAVEYNLNILDKVKYPGCRLHAGDQLEIVHFVGGGTWEID